MGNFNMLLGQSLLSSLRHHAHAFPLSGSQVEVLETPDQFFKALVDGLETAQHHVTLASLYIGSEEGGREQQFVSALAAAAHDASRPGLTIYILLDALRSTRPTKLPDGSFSSTAEELAGALLTGSASATINVSLFHTPALRGLLRRLLPPRVREVVGVQHMKAYAFDDTLLISGANLSQTYFANRQDRYLLVKGAPELAGFVRQVVRTVAQFSYQLQPLENPVQTPLQRRSEPVQPGTATAGGGSAGAASSSLSGGTACGSSSLTAAEHGLAGAAAPTAAAAAEEAAWGRTVASVEGVGPRQGGVLGRRPLVDLVLQRAQQLQQLSSGGPWPARFPSHLLPRGRQGPGDSGSSQGGGGGGGFSLAPPPAGLDPTQHARQFRHSLRQALLRLFVPPGGEAGVVDWSVLAAEEEEGMYGHPLPPKATQGPAHSDGGGGFGSGSSWPLDKGSSRAPPGASAANDRNGAGPGDGSSLDSGSARSMPGRLRPVEGEQRSGGALQAPLAAGPVNLAAAGPAAAPGPAAAAGVAGGAASGAAGAAAGTVDTWIIPLTQAGFVGLRQEERCMLRMLSWAAQSGATHCSGSGGLLQVSTPYLNLARPFEWVLAESRQLGLELLTASPEANGFFGSKGASGYIPQAYSLLEHRTWKRLTRPERAVRWHRGAASMAWPSPLPLPPQQQGLSLPPGALPLAAPSSGQPLAGQQQQTLQPHEARTAAGPLAAGVQWGEGSQAQAHAARPGSRRLLEYAREGYSFHAKGLWFTPAHTSSPCMTAVGSSNFGFRSLHRDLELQFLLVTHNPRLQQALGQEFGRLRHFAQAVCDAHFQRPGRAGGPVARMAVRLLRSFL